MITDYDDDVCDAPAPETIEFYRSHFGGEGRAKCTECNFVSIYWECGHELEHDCDQYQ